MRLGQLERSFCYFLVLEISGHKSVFCNNPRKSAAPFVLQVLFGEPEDKDAGVARPGHYHTWECLTFSSAPHPGEVPGRTSFSDPLSYWGCSASDTCAQMSVSRTCLPYPGLTPEINLSAHSGLSPRTSAYRSPVWPWACWQWRPEAVEVQDSLPETVLNSIMLHFL